MLALGKCVCNYLHCEVFSTRVTAPDSGFDKYSNESGSIMRFST